MESYEIEWQRSARRETKKLDNVTTRRIIDAVMKLKTDPLPVGVRKLRGGQNSYRIRVGDDRIVFVIFPAERRVVITAVGHRREVYRDD